MRLQSKYGEIGGVMGWEYFNSAPGGRREPWVWAQEMTSVLRPNATFDLAITTKTANKLQNAWANSVIHSKEGHDNFDAQLIIPNINYTAMVNFQENGRGGIIKKEAWFKLNLNHIP